MISASASVDWHSFFSIFNQYVVQDPVYLPTDVKHLSTWVVTKESQGTLHSHPIGVQEVKKLTK